MNCPHCGHALPEDASFCTNCGNQVPARPEQKPVAEEQPASTSQPAAEQPAPTAQPAAAEQTQAPEAKPANKNQKIYSIIGLVAGIVLVILGIVRILMGMGVIGKPQQEPQQQVQQQSVEQPTTQTTSQQTTQTTTPDDTSTTSTVPTTEDKKVDSSKFLDKNGYVTMYACAELDGKGLYDVISKQDYDLISDDGTSYFTPNGTKYALIVYIGKDEKPAGFNELKSLSGVAGKGTPVWYNMICSQYTSLKDAVAGLGNITFDKYIEGTEVEVGILKNAQGDKLLFMAYMSDNNIPVMQLYNEDCAAAGGVGENVGHSVDECYANLEKALKGNKDASADKIVGEGSSVDLNAESSAQ